MDEETVHAELVSVFNHRLPIEEIRDNNPSITNLSIPPDVHRLSDKAWRLLGRYIANNTHLQELTILIDDTMSSLFRGLTKSSSIEGKSDPDSFEESKQKDSM